MLKISTQKTDSHKQNYQIVIGNSDPKIWVLSWHEESEDCQSYC